MKEYIIRTLFEAMLVLSIVFAPAVCIAEENNFQQSLLNFNNFDKKEIITSEFNLNEGNNLCNIPTGSIVHYSSEGITTVFDSEGRQSFFAVDEEATKVSTPSGMKAATQVFEIPSGSEIDTKGNITYVYNNGETILTVVNENKKESEIIPDYDGWLETSVDEGIDDLSMFRAYWRVPSSPSNPDDDAVDFLFNAIQPNEGGAIVQPVLEWNQAGSGRWTGASWSVKNDISFHSTRINVDVGDTIQGNMLWDDYRNRWYIGFKDVTDNNLVYIYSRDADDTDLDVFTTLEAYQVDDNDDLPGDTTFYSMVFKDADNDAIAVSWDERYYPGVPAAIDGLDVVVYSSSQVKLKT